MTYKGVPRKLPLFIDSTVDGKLNVVEGSFSPIVTGSGSLVAGYAAVEDNSIGWHTTVMLCAVSGTDTQALAYSVDAEAHTLHVSGEDSADVRRFSYTLFNPGLGTPKA